MKVRLIEGLLEDVAIDTNTAFRNSKKYFRSWNIGLAEHVDIMTCTYMTWNFMTLLRSKHTTAYRIVFI